MKPDRCTVARAARRACWLLAAACGLWCLPAAGHAQQAWRIVVPFAAGGTQDLVARILARHLFEGSGQAVVVDNRPGADTAIGTRLVMRAPPDGKTLLIAATSIVFLGLKNPNEFDIQKDLQPVIKIANGEMLLAVHPSLDVRTAADLRRAAEARPGGLNCAALPGQTVLACDRLAQLLGGAMTTVPFHSLAPAVSALVAGHVDVLFTPRAAVQPLEAQQRVRILASAGNTAALAPYQNLPLLKDTWPSLRMFTTVSIFAPAGTPPDIVLMLNRELNRIIELPEVRSGMTELGYSFIGGSPEFMARSLADEIAYYRSLMREVETKGSEGSR